ncbi:MAG: 1,4-alpha-glucan branching protein GlgB [Panacagrimonas sp.]
MSDADDGESIGEFDRQVFGQGRHAHAWRFLGAHLVEHKKVSGARFATWAPRARSVSVIGDFSGWNGAGHTLHPYPGGIWSGFVPGVAAGAFYKFRIEAADGTVVLKADPYARQAQLRPETASVIAAPSAHVWTDEAWMHARVNRDWPHDPISIYEAHAASWRRDTDAMPGYRELAETLVPYARTMGFTHIELLPISEHPYDPSWGYQSLGQFAPTSRHGTPDDFRAFVDRCHAEGVGVILDWVPAHFPRDAHGLARFDGEPLYEYGDPRRGEQPDWDTLVYDFGRPEVRNYLLASALYWLEEFHVDGLRVDAVASMLYLDYSRAPGEWLPNRHGGRENLEAVDFLRELNSMVRARHPGALVIAEESTAWPGVTRTAESGGLGFSMKWNMGWMHDTLEVLRTDPLFRGARHDRLTFGITYAFSENFVLALSHDEVVHGKGSLLGKMHGDDWQRFANLRLLYTWQWTHPGKKLLFMGQEFAQAREWSQDRSLDWTLLEAPAHAGVQQLVRDLNRVHREWPALHRLDFAPQGFEWLTCDDRDHSVLAFLRRDEAGGVVLVVLNFTPTVRHDYRIGVPLPGRWIERLNSDSAHYGGSNCGNFGGCDSDPVPCMNQAQSLCLSLPPLAGLVLVPMTAGKELGVPGAFERPQAR